MQSADTTLHSNVKVLVVQVIEAAMQEVEGGKLLLLCS